MEPERYTGSYEQFFWTWFVELQTLTPQQSLAILEGSSVELFTQLLRDTLPPEEFDQLTAKQIQTIHEAMRDWLFVSVGAMQHRPLQ